MASKKNQPTSIDLTIGEATFELLTDTPDDSGAYLVAGSTQAIGTYVEAAITSGKLAAAAVEKSTGLSRKLGRNLVGVMLQWRNPDGFPILSRKVQTDTYREIEEAIFSAAVPMPADTPANAEKRAVALQRLADLRNAVKVELSRDLTEEAIVNYCLDAVQPPLTPEEATKLNRGGWQGGTPGDNGRPGKLQIGFAPERLQVLVKAVYAANTALKVPTNLGGTKTIGSKGTNGGNDGKLAKSKVTDLSMAATSIESGGLSENGLSESCVALFAAFYRRAASGEVSTGIERETVATNMAICRDYADAIGRIYNGTITASVRAKLDALAGVNAPEGVETGAEAEEVATV